MKTNKAIREPHYDYPMGGMTLTQQRRHLNLTENSFYTLFPAKGIMSYRHVIPSCLYVPSKGTCTLASRGLLNR